MNVFFSPLCCLKDYNALHILTNWCFEYALDGPTEASLSPHKDFQSEGDELICSAEAYPMPRFVWTILENNATVDGPVLVIRFEMIRADSTSIQCTAINDVTAIEAKSHIVKINSGDTGKPSL